MTLPLTHRTEERDYCAVTSVGFIAHTFDSEAACLAWCAGKPWLTPSERVKTTSTTLSPIVIRDRRGRFVRATEVEVRV
jgi:hypothetical protein